MQLSEIYTTAPLAEDEPVSITSIDFGLLATPALLLSGSEEEVPVRTALNAPVIAYVCNKKMSCDKKYIL